MEWSNYIQHFYPLIAKYFSKIIKADSWHHAYLFIGNEELGLDRISKEIALNMINTRLSNEEYKEKIKNQFYKGTYPDLYILERLYDDKKKKLNQNITIEQVRELKSKIQHKSFLNLPKIIIIKDVDRLNKDSANALLKALEEPAKETIFFLLTENLSVVLDTIISRCQNIRFYQQSLVKVKDFLKTEYAISSEKATNIAHLSSGLPERAIAYQKNIDIYNEYLEYIDKVLEIFSVLLHKRFEIVHDLIPKKVKDYNSKKALAEKLLNLLEIIFRDMLLMKQSLDNLIYLELRYKELKEISQRYSQEEITKCLEMIQESRIALRQNLNISLVLENLLVNI